MTARVALAEVALAAGRVLIIFARCVRPRASEPAGLEQRANLRTRQTEQRSPLSR